MGIENSELRVDVRTTGKEQLDNIANALRVLEQQMLTTNMSVERFDALQAAQKGLLAEQASILGQQADAHKKVEEAVRQHSEAVKSFGENIKNGIENPLQAAGSVLSSFVEKLGPLGVGAAAGAGILGAMGMAAFESAKKLGELGTEITNVSIRTGLTTEQVGLFAYSAKLAGADISSLEMGMKMFSRALSDSGEEGKKAKAELADMGIKTHDLNGVLRPINDLFLEISEALGKMSNRAEQATAAQALFSRAGIELLPMLLHLRENLDEAHRAGAETFGGDQLRQMEEFHRKVLDIENAIAKAWHTTEFWGASLLTIWASAPSQHLQYKDGQLVPAGPGSAPATRMPFTPVSLGPQMSLGEALNAGLLANHPDLGILEFLGAKDAQAATNAYIDQVGGLGFAKGRKGAQQQYQQAQTEADKQWEKLQDLKDSGASMSIAQTQADKWEKAEAAATKYKNVLDSIIEAEKLAKEGSTFKYNADRPDWRGQGTTRVVNGMLVSTTGITPSLFPRNADPNALTSLELSGANTPIADTGQSAQDKAYAAGELDLTQKNQQFRDLQNSLATTAKVNAATRDDSSARVRANVVPGSGDDLKSRLDLIKQIHDIELSAATDRFEVAKIESRYLEDSAQARLDIENKIAEKRSEAAKEFSGGLFDALTTGMGTKGGTGGAVANFFKGQGMGQAKIIGENLLSPLVENLTPHFGDGSGLLKGTMFSGSAKADPSIKLDGSATKLSEAAGDLKTAARVLASARSGSAAAGISGGGPTGIMGGGAPGDGSMSSDGLSLSDSMGPIPGMSSSGYTLDSTGSASGLTTALSSLGIAGPAAAAVATAIRAGVSPSATAGALVQSLTSASKSFGQNAMVGASDPFAALSGNLGTAGSDGEEGGSLGAAGKIGAIGALTAAGFGVFQGAQDIAKGGAYGITGGVGKIAGSIAAVDPEPISKAILGSVALVSSVVTAIMGDPRLQRAQQESRHLAADQYYAPQAINESVSTGGTYSDYGRGGFDRTSPFSPVPEVQQSTYDFRHQQLVPGRTISQFGGAAAAPNITITALDSNSLHSYLQKNSDTVADSILKAVGDGHALTPRLREAMLGS